LIIDKSVRSQFDSVHCVFCRLPSYFNV